MKAADYPVLSRENGHEFIQWKQDKYLSCRNCGNIRRADGLNSPCRGKVKIALREITLDDAKHLNQVGDYE